MRACVRACECMHGWPGWAGRAMMVMGERENCVHSSVTRTIFIMLPPPRANQANELVRKTNWSERGRAGGRAARGMRGNCMVQHPPRCFGCGVSPLRLASVAMSSWCGSHQPDLMPITPSLFESVYTHWVVCVYV